MRLVKYTQRIFKRDKFFTLVNLLGLSLGMFCFLVTALYVRDEYTHDQWHENADRIYFPIIAMERGGGVSFNLYPTILIGDALKESSPGVENVVNIGMDGDAQFKIGGDWIETSSFVYTQPSLFDVFDFDLKYGNKITALSEPDNIVLSLEVAERYFSGRNPVGEFIEFKDIGRKIVSGVLKSIPSNSHLQFEILAPIDFNIEPYKSYKSNWNTGPGLNYIQLKEGYSLGQLKEDVQQVLAKHEGARYADQYQYISFADAYMSGETMRFNSKNMFGGQLKYIFIFALIGGLILIVACFNYINLTTARSLSRSKDIGIRKVIGASKKQLVFGQMMETLYVSSLALIIALIGLELLLPLINELIGKGLNLSFTHAFDILLLPLGLLTLVVLFSGIYPALTLSTLSLSSVLKGNSPKSGSTIFRKSLIVFQFLICCGLFTGALIIRGQANHMMNLDLGYNQENILSVSLTETKMGEKYQALKTALERIPAIDKVSGSPLPKLNSVTFFEVGEGEEKIPISAFYGVADKDFNEIMGLEILQGTDFSGLTESELATAVLINEKTAKVLGWDEPIGKKLSEGMIVRGVVKDFHYSSAHNEINTALIKYGVDEIQNIQFSFRQRDKEAVKAQVVGVFESFGVDEIFEMSEISDFFTDSYNKEAKLVSIFDVLTGLLVVIAFLGLFALSTFENQLRQKEIGIRKVLGASYLQLLNALNNRFLILIAIALIISVPITYYLINQWLSSFAYRIENLSPYFAMAIASVVILAIAVLSIHSYMNARKNPVNVLRNE